MEAERTAKLYLLETNPFRDGQLVIYCVHLRITAHGDAELQAGLPDAFRTVVKGARQLIRGYQARQAAA